MRRGAPWLGALLLLTVSSARAGDTVSAPTVAEDAVGVPAALGDAKTAPAGGAPAGLGWIYVESNVGGSSGGHLALRVDETIYHVQQGPEGLFELNREKWRTFHHLYAGLQNRSLHVATLDVSDDDLERVRRRLARAYVVYRSALAARERHREDRAWLEAWREGALPPALASAGLLAPGDAPDPDGVVLREALAERLGRDFLREERTRVEAAITAFSVRDGDLLALREQLLLRRALEAIEGDFGLAGDATLPIGGAVAGPLGDDEREAARHFAAANLDAAAELLRSQRPDRGAPLLLAVARHHALARSAASGRLLLLDPYAGRTAVAEAIVPDTAARVAADLVPVIEAGRPNVLSGTRWDEARYNLLERGVSVLHEFSEGAEGRAVRKLPGQAVPAAPAVLAFAPRSLAPAHLADAIARTDRALEDADARLLADYRYGVLQHNCVTELVRLLNSSFPEGEAATALGAELEPGAGLQFIPWVFYDAAVAGFRIEATEDLPSHRHRELARLAEEEPGLAWRIREASALTSAIYTPRLRDSQFLFFTDDVFWRRPLLGVLNFGYALGSTVPGLVAAPFDGAERLRAAGAGLWYSLPELAFWNIRKGSFAYVADPQAPPSTPTATDRAAHHAPGPAR